ncbi:uncharacterized mitochondrial protein AtMg00810-like [Solanum lycopersicum]|uniref:uncharacterized mitochondrial protein AtMg00810-like n=1 Tax=Solanum lycopersicum TaxID=4081 RepID=UPI003749BD7F
MSDLGLLNYFLGIEVSQVKEGIFVSQKKYTESILQKFKIMDCRFVVIPLATNEKFRKDDGEKKANSSLYRSLIGSLLYLTSTRSDIMFASNLLSIFMQETSQVHYRATKRVLRYLQGIMDYEIIFYFGGDLNLIGYSDSDWAGRINDMKTIAIAKNPASHERSKHISIKYHFILEAQEKDEILLHFQTGEKLADIFTKDFLEKNFVALELSSK